jgi:hypothetical protein
MSALPDGVTVADLDLRWLGPRHHQRLAEGRLKLPDVANHFDRGGHDAALVSVPDDVCGTEVAWVDRDIAELVWLLNHEHGVTTLEACQGGPGGPDGPEGWAYLAIRGRRNTNRFLALAGDALRGETVERWFRVSVVRFPHEQVPGITREVAAT